MQPPVVICLQSFLQLALCHPKQGVVKFSFRDPVTPRPSALIPRYPPPHTSTPVRKLESLHSPSCVCLVRLVQGAHSARLLLRDWLVLLASNYHRVAHQGAATRGPAALAQAPVGARGVGRDAGGVQEERLRGCRVVRWDAVVIGSCQGICRRTFRGSWACMLHAWRVC